MIPLTAAEFEPDFPDHDLVVYRNAAANVECLIAIPKAKLRALRDAGDKPPFWRHGEVMNVRPAEAADAVA